MTNAITTLGNAWANCWPMLLLGGHRAGLRPSGRISGGPADSGVANLPNDGPPPVNVFQPGARYEKIMEAFGGKGFYCETPDQLAKALRTAFDSGETALLNVAIAPTAKKAPQTYSHWLSR